MPVICDFCGRAAPLGESGEETVPLTWSTSVEHVRLRRYCDVCSRENLRAMEGKLDSDHW